jgi:hypothetical protein
MLDLDFLSSVGVSSEAYKNIFTLPREKMQESTQGLVRWLSSLITDTRRQNFREWRTHRAVDLAYETPFAQTTPTILAHILDQRMDHGKTVQALRGWGLREEDLYLTVPITDEKGEPRRGEDGKSLIGKLLNPSVAVPILLPIVRSYLAMRLAKIFNERNVHPFLKLEPLRGTHRSQAASEIMTDIVDRISTAYGYPAVFRQGLMQMLKYAVALAFPLEEWHTEYHAEATDEIGLDGKPLINKRVLDREGLRYYWPHPTRMAYDTMHPLTSFNTDSGCEWALHWRVIPYSDVEDSELYWNKGSIFQGTNWFNFPGLGPFFEEVYPCTMEPLTGAYDSTSKLREDENYWYTSSARNRATFITEIFAKISPKRWGLSEYRDKVWHRFTIAGDDTVIFANPCAYPPVWFLGYDYDQQASQNASLALECIPWQDEVGNILNQIIEHAKQNLAQIIFYNELAVKKMNIDRIHNSGNRVYRENCFIGFDPAVMYGMRQQLGEIFYKVDLGGKPVIELLQTIPLVLNMMERMLQISPQEAGTAASHQQSKEEVTQTAGAGMNRVTFTCSYVDEGLAAWKRQLHAAIIAYMDPNLEAEVSADIPDIANVLADLGFKKTGDGNGTILVKGPKHKLRLEAFADTGRSLDPGRDKELAQVIFQTVGTIAGQEDLHKAFGAAKLMEMIRAGYLLAGGEPDKFPPYVEQEVAADVPKAVQDAIQKTMQVVEQNIAQKVAQPIAKEMAGEQQEITQLQETLKQFAAIAQTMKDAQDKLALRAKEEQQREQMRAAEFQEAERRKEEAHQAELRQQAEKTQAAIAAQAAETQAGINDDRLKAEAAAEAAQSKANQAPT